MTPLPFPRLAYAADSADLSNLSPASLEIALAQAKTVVRARQSALRTALVAMERVHTEIDRRNAARSAPSKRT